jgi:uncharacterized protein YjiS (DUF1127 family)
MLRTITADTVELRNAASGPNPLLRMVVEAAQAVAGWAERRRQLRALSELEDHLLRDVGLSRDDVRRACARNFRMH